VDARKTGRAVPWAATALMLVAGTVSGQSPSTDGPPEERAEIVAVALDYIEGWFDGDTTRLRSALHPDLVKRRMGGSGEVLDQDVETLVGMAGRMGGGDAPADLSDRVRILDRTEGSAVVRIDAPAWTDLLLIARVRGRWTIVQVLWEPSASERPVRRGDRSASSGAGGLRGDPDWALHVAGAGARAYTLPSQVLGEERRVYVHLPPSHSRTDRPYPVILVLDGEAIFGSAVQAAAALASAGHMPEAVIVGVENTDRLRDLAPPGIPVSGNDGTAAPIASCGSSCPSCCLPSRKSSVPAAPGCSWVTLPEGSSSTMPSPGSRHSFPGRSPSMRRCTWETALPQISYSKTLGPSGGRRTW